MSRYIDADNLALFIVEHLPRSAPQDAYDAYFDVLRMLKDEKAVPTVDVKKDVRCFECKYSHISTKDMILKCRLNNDHHTDPYGYCYKGKEKEG